CGWGLSDAASCAQGQLAPPASGASWAGAGSMQPDIVWPSGKWRAPAFTLTNQEGRPVSLAGLRGHIVALDFLSVTCRGQCPVEGRQLARVEALLGARRAGVDFITVSVEPESDSRQAAVAFGRTAGLGQRWQYLMGTRRALTHVWHSYYVAAASPPVKGQPDADPIHSLGLYLIDQRGDVRAYFDAPTSGRVAAAIGALLP
ncbi:MAG: SCO family protein, partial [Chloroflexota bacterium]|nr:SCO family protein [Chloroflexota bacterium]